MNNDDETTIEKGVKDGVTVAQYLAVAENLQDSVQMHALNQQATLADGVPVLQLYNVADLFMTQGGTLEEPALARVPDDHLS